MLTTRLTAVSTFNDGPEHRAGGSMTTRRLPCLLSGLLRQSVLAMTIALHRVRGCRRHLHPVQGV